MKNKIFNLGNLFILIFIIISALVWYRVDEVYSTKTTQKLIITFLNVGQGDSILITTPQKKAILIDGGTYPREWSTFDAGKYVVVPYLKRQGIRKLDMVIATHPDLDHIGGLLAVLEYFHVDLFLDSGTISTTQTYEDLLKLVEQKKIKYKIANPSKIQLEPSLSLQILSPISQNFSDDPNNNSIVIKLKYGNISFLLTADITEAAENLYVKQYGEKLKCHILKVPHHGSNSSNSGLFLSYVQPETAIISVGKNNPFGHPSQTVLERFKNIDVYRTDINGHITVSTDGKEYRITTQRR